MVEGTYTGGVTLNSLPGVDVPPPGVMIPRAARRARARLARRDFLRLAGAAAVGTGLAFAGMFPTARPAFAGHLTPSTTSNGCYGPTRTNQSLAGSTGCCTCGSNVSSNWCSSEYWHKHHTEMGSGYANYYRLRLDSCKGKTSAGTTATGKNSWIWTLNGVKWRCSDGEKKECYQTSSGTTCVGYNLSVCATRNGV